MVATDPATVATIVLAAVIYSAAHYLPKRAGPNEEPWELRKVIKTAVIAVLVAAYALYQGITLTPTNLPQIAMSIGAVGVAEKAAQLIVRLIRRFRGDYGTAGGN